MAPVEQLRACPGTRTRAGVSLSASGAEFAIYSEHARSVSLEIDDGERVQTFSMQERDGLWCISIEGAKSGMAYGYRVQTAGGSGDKGTEGLLLDPFARLVLGEYDRHSQLGTCGLIGRLASDDDFDWESDASPKIPMSQSVLYEVHVKGATKLLESVPESMRGTYLGLASEAFISHVKALGVTALNLLPIHRHIDEDRLIGKGLTNYWGYNTVGYFAPETHYAVEPQRARDEFRTMVKRLHAAGLEVILDVVYNHTAETDECGPTLSWRGIDNRTYYRVREDNPNLYDNFTGCGNTIRIQHLATLDFVLESLRYWVRVMHVDGFRFDLAATLIRESGFLEAIRSDPVLSSVKLIAEPWDIGPGGYKLGQFPNSWSEWNDRYRDDVRSFWLTKSVGIGALAGRLCASSDVFRRDGRTPQASLNFITAHDGFTLADLVSYVGKHNEANGEENRDGCGDNRSVNCGVEGETDDASILKRRRALRRSLLATLFLSQGVPMLVAGDEFARTQRGNNNAYCQDNATTWMAWDSKEDDTAFVSRLCGIRSRFERLHSSQWLTGGADASGSRDVVWWHASGREMQSSDWNAETSSIGMLLGRTQESSRLFVLFHRDQEKISFHLPEGQWKTLFDTDEASDGLTFENVLSIEGPRVLVFEEVEQHYDRMGGALLHVTSLPGPYGSGDFGSEAYRFVDWLQSAGLRLWQVLPLTVTGEGHSPYMGASVFAGNELLIDLQALLEMGLLSKNDLQYGIPFATNRVEFDRVTAFRFYCLRKAASRFFTSKELPSDYLDFVESSASWLEDYALYRTIASEEMKRGHLRWQDWPEALRSRNLEALQEIRSRFSTEVDFWRFAQWCFDSQVRKLKAYANACGVHIVGDLPIYVSPEGADVWAHQDLFQLDSVGEPTAVAGVPPDYFSPTGQWWGNPLYDWERHEETQYAWWNARLERAASMYDVIRIDHFRGFEAYWSIPSDAENALAGEWKKGPGAKPFQRILAEHPNTRFIGEDLGTITPEVDALRRQLGFPGMRVLQFAFSGQPDNPHLPSNVGENIAFYPGTHDNDTVEGWAETLSPEVLEQVGALLGDAGTVHDRMVETVFASKARYAVAMVQDFIGLDDAHRMNRPGDATESWGWRLEQGFLMDKLAERVNTLVSNTHRKGE